MIINVNVEINKSKNCNPLLNEKSAFLSFPYNEALINYIKNLRYRYYDAKIKTWEIEEKELLNLCKIFNTKEYIFNIIDKYIEPKQESYNIQIPQSYNFYLKPLEYQKEGILYGLNHSKFLLADQPGLGKTAQSLYISDIKSKAKVLIIVCSASLKYNWVEEIKKTLGRDDSHVLGTIIKTKKNGEISEKEGNGQDKLNDLINIDKIKEKYIITNRETLYLLSKKKGRSYQFPIAEEINNLCKQNKIDYIIVDEIHKGCLAGDTKIITDKGNLLIKDIVDKKIKCNVLTINEQTKKQEYKPILDYLKLKPLGDFLELTFTDNKTFGGIRHIKCTSDHKFFTTNRGWVEARNLNEDDDVQFINYYPNRTLNEKQLNYLIKHKDDMALTEIAKNLGMSRYKLLKNIDFYNIIIDKERQKELSLQNQKNTCLSLYGVSTCLQKEEVINNNKIRMKTNNPMNNPIVRETATKNMIKTRKSHNKLNCWNGGNGKISPTEHLVYNFMISLGFEYNKGISTKTYKKKHPNIKIPFCYKPDFIHKEKKICIELDGNTHNNKIQKQLDKKKDMVEKDMGYKVYRFTNKYIIENLEKFKKDIENII